MLLLALFTLFISSTNASHFFGTVMTYYPKEPLADGSVSVTVRYKFGFHSCGSDTWSCTGNCGSQTITPSTKVDQETNGTWCQTEGIMTRVVPNNDPFQLRLDSGNWIENVNNIVNWRAQTDVELRNRSDTGRANTSPQTTVIPLVRVPSNCQRNFDLLAFDPDGDVVQCRNGNASLFECNPCTPASVLSVSSSCNLSFSPTSSSNEGSYAVQLVMEDFPRQTIILTHTNGTVMEKTTSETISKIPVQFALQVDPVVPSCTEGVYLPKFLPPTPDHKAQLYAPVGQTLEINITAEATSSVSISELLFSGPYNVIKNSMSSGQFSLKWTPSVVEDRQSHPLCFVVQASSSGTMYQSELRCVIVTVGNSPPTTAPFPPTTVEMATTESTTTVDTFAMTIEPITHDEPFATPREDTLATTIEPTTPEDTLAPTTEPITHDEPFATTTKPTTPEDTLAPTTEPITHDEPFATPREDTLATTIEPTTPQDTLAPTTEPITLDEPFATTPQGTLAPTTEPITHDEPFATPREDTLATTIEPTTPEDTLAPTTQPITHDEPFATPREDTLATTIEPTTPEDTLAPTTEPITHDEPFATTPQDTLAPTTEPITHDEPFATTTKDTLATTIEPTIQEDTLATTIEHITHDAPFATTIEPTTPEDTLAPTTEPITHDEPFATTQEEPFATTIEPTTPKDTLATTLATIRSTTTENTSSTIHKTTDTPTTVEVFDPTTRLVPTTASGPFYVIGLRMRISTSLSLEKDINTILAQLKQAMVERGVPSAMTLRLLSSTKVTSSG